MPQAPYIPGPDAVFNNWAVNFGALITAVPATYGLVAGDAVAINAVLAPWVAAYADATNPATRTAVTIAAKDAARLALEAVVRPYAIDISRNPAVDNGDKVAVGVNLPNTARTPIPPPTTQPGLSLVSAVHNLMTIAYRDTSTPTSKAKPYGVIGLDLRLHVGPGAVPVPDDIAPYGMATKSPVNVGFTNPQVGQTATFFGRWQTKSGPGGASQFGPWSAALAVSIV